ncbi:MAG: hypothetical protein KDA68_00815 [Planctomycetaceae bacterium]|nr:hypothetical protein [Planctomycetaceae bacterium]
MTSEHSDNQPGDVSHPLWRVWSLLWRNSLRAIVLTTLLLVLASPFILRKIHAVKISRAAIETVSAYTKKHYACDYIAVSYIISEDEVRVSAMKRMHDNFVILDSMLLDFRLSPDGRQIRQVEEIDP